MKQMLGVRLSMLPLFFICVVSAFLLSACGESGSGSPADVAEEFWKAVQSKDMESAKDLSTWETVVYLEVLNKDDFKPERFELGETMVGDTRAEIETILYSSKIGEEGVKIPGMTVLVKTDKGWRVHVKNSITAVLRSSANSFVGQLNGVMQEGLKGLDKALGDVVNEIGSSFEEGAEEFKKEFNKEFDKSFFRSNDK